MCARQHVWLMHIKKGLSAHGNSPHSFFRSINPAYIPSMLKTTHYLENHSENIFFRLKRTQPLPDER